MIGWQVYVMARYVEFLGAGYAFNILWISRSIRADNRTPLSQGQGPTSTYPLKTTQIPRSHHMRITSAKIPIILSRTMPTNFRDRQGIQRRPLSTFSQKDTTGNKFHRCKATSPCAWYPSRALRHRLIKEPHMSWTLFPWPTRPLHLYFPSNKGSSYHFLIT